MKIIYKQAVEDCESSLFRFGIQSCYLKYLKPDKDCKFITKKMHHHLCFEMHIIKAGYQEYRIKETVYRLEKGDIMLIYPGVAHKELQSAEDTEKYSITFELKTEADTGCFYGKVTEGICNAIRFIEGEMQLKRKTSMILAENRLLEIIILVLRESGFKEQSADFRYDENAIMGLAKQYINDNIESSPNVCEVAAYCHMSTKQLGRIFIRCEGVSPKEYIGKQRVRKIENLLCNETLSLNQISEKMNFCNEYYFNIFCKNHIGMPPGKYRKMLGT